MLGVSARCRGLVCRRLIVRANKYLERPATQLRRKDRTLDDDGWIDRLLSVAAAGHLAVVWEGTPLIHSNLYWFDGKQVYWHTGGVGRLRAVLDMGPARACFTVTEHGRILPAHTPLEFSTEYASVVLYGTVFVVTDPGEKRRGLEGLMSKYAAHLKPGVDYTPMPDDDVAQTSVYRMEIESRVAKHNIKPRDYPAYTYAGGSFIDMERRAGRLTMKVKELS
jgi:nitroimidazol reductase NimA-like FMN-containing flavoprotein (pyridoxamine 5'-phosphate oxidase superfamily)